MRIRDDNCRRMYQMFLCSSVKAGHWETEKAECKNAKLYALYDMSRKTCFDVVPYGNDFFVHI